VALQRLPGRLLRLEGLALLGGSVAIYVDQDFNWVLFAVIAVAPDLSLAAYAAGPRLGAVGYDLVHTTVAPLVLGAVGLVADSTLAVEIALVWLAHIGVDRLIGYGLKYPSGFKETHLQRV
jgi:hypothetical protein